MWKLKFKSVSIACLLLIFNQAILGKPRSEVHPGKNLFRKFTRSEDKFYAITKSHPKSLRCLSLSNWKQYKFEFNFLCNKKFKIWFDFFTCILPDNVAHDITKEFWRNSHFEKITAGFLLRCQNLLRRNTPEIMQFQAWNFLSLPILPL